MNKKEQKEIEKLLKNDDMELRRKAWYKIDNLSYSRNWKDRIFCVKHKYFLNTFLADPKKKVRKAAKKELKKMVYSDCCEERLDAANAGFGYKYLVHDKDGEVRAAVARGGYKLKHLAHDESAEVRFNVAWAASEYNEPKILEILIFDKDENVCRQAIESAEYIKQHY